MITKHANCSSETESMKAILNDLLEFKKVLLEEVSQSQAGDKNDASSNALVDKLNYRINILTTSYQELLESSEREREKLKQEVERLNYRIGILKENIRCD